MIFDCLINTDGFGVYFVFVRKKKKASATTKKAMFTLVDFDRQYIENFFMPCTVDPGRKSVLSAAVVQDSSSHKIRSCKAKERECCTGSKRRLRFVDELKATTGIKRIKMKIPSSKTGSIQETTNYIKYILTNSDALFNFCSIKTAIFRFHDYQGRQHANDELANILIDGGEYKKARRKIRQREKCDWN
ncbi:hypothetical protein K501DRAFT_193937 [Backusella circina FSU 941]|nr:hypothetical protein K501DRAFT_193937 [Backusella circina FSU 941]